jgi:hypothetical protein
LKVLLAPLYFRSRFCRHCRRVFHRDNPDKWLGIWEFETLPPLGSFEPGVGFRPDLPGLLMFDEFVLDSEAHDILLNPAKRPWLGAWPDLVRALDSEGVTTITDVRAAAGRDSRRRGAALRRDMLRPSRWFQAMAYYDAVASRAHDLLGDDPRTAQKACWDFDPEVMYGTTGTDGKGHSLAVVLSEGSKSADSAHRDLYDFALHEVRSHLREVNACLVAC